MRKFPFSNSGKRLAFASVFTFENPALIAFVTRLGNELTFGQVLIRRSGSGFELRHVSEREAAPESLRAVALSELRLLAQFTASGVFRPLKAAPDLAAGWRSVIPTEAALETALNHFYPGALADWFAAQSTRPPVTHYRASTQRQTGMYRIAHLLTDEQAAQTIRVTCAPAACLKQRLWSVTGLTPDAAEGKSVIPCLEPCAILLEAARKAARAEQEAQRSSGSKLASEAGSA